MLCGLGDSTWVTEGLLVGLGPGGPFSHAASPQEEFCELG